MAPNWHANAETCPKRDFKGTLLFYRQATKYEPMQRRTYAAQSGILLTKSLILSAILQVAL